MIIIMNIMIMIAIFLMFLGTFILHKRPRKVTLMMKYDVRLIKSLKKNTRSGR